MFDFKACGLSASQAALGNKDRRLQESKIGESLREKGSRGPVPKTGHEEQGFQLNDEKKKEYCAQYSGFKQPGGNPPPSPTPAR